MPRFMWASLSTCCYFRSAAVAVMALVSTCLGLYCRPGITHSQKCLGSEENLYSSLGYIPEYPRKQVIPTVRSLLCPLGLLYSPLPTKKESSDLQDQKTQ